MSKLVFGADADGVAGSLPSANTWLRSSTTNLSGALFHMAGLLLVLVAHAAGSTGAGIVMSSAAGFNDLNVTPAEIGYVRTCHWLGDSLRASRSATNPASARRTASG